MNETSGSPTTFLALSQAERRSAVTALGGRSFHADVIERELFQNGRLAYDAMSGLSKALRAALARELPLLAGEEVERSEARDGTVKLLLAFEGNARVETVFMPGLGAKKDLGATLCVSTQVGCAVGCPFCASGLFGLQRNLAAHEIVEQYVRGRALGPLRRSVVMGIGEPLLNYTAVDAALVCVRSDFGLGARKITVSTVGFPERLRRIAPLRPGFQLAISLHSPDDDERGRLVPAMAGIPVEEVLAAGDFWFEQTGREVTYEYVLLAGTNDDEPHARRLAERLARRRATVNLIPYNPVATTGERRPSAESAATFQRILSEAGVVATVRWSRGVETDAACGQLRIAAGAAR